MSQLVTPSIVTIAIEATVAARESNPIGVPVTSIYSKNDGIKVCATYLGMGVSRERN